MANLVVYGSHLSQFVRKVEAVLHEKGLEYDFVEVNIMDMPDWYKEISPLRRIPVLRDRSVGEEGINGSIPDSSAICAYLERIAPSPRLIPEDAYDAARTLWFEEYADTEMATHMGGFLFRPIFFPLMQGKEPDLETARKTFREKLPEIFGYLESSLADDGYFVGGALTLADIAVTGQLAQLDLTIGPLDANRWPKLAAHYQKIAGSEGIAANLAICAEILKPVLPEKIDLN